MEGNSERSIVFKVLILGDTAVGKTSIFHRFTSGTFTKDYKSTIGVDFAVKRIKWAENIEITLNFWDMAGQERFYEACKSHFRNTDGVFCVLDLSNPATAKKCHDWKDRAINLSTNYNGESNNPPIICLGNKFDLFDPKQFTFDIADTAHQADGDLDLEDIPLDNTPRDGDIVVDSLLLETVDQYKNKFSEWSKESGYENGFMVSAKTKEGVDECLSTMISIMIDRYMQDESEQKQEKDSEVFQLGSKKDGKMQEQSYLSYYYNSFVGRC